VIAELENLEAIKTFIVLLFLAQKGNVSLWQDESLGDIYITISGASASQKPSVGIV
jgi:chromatin segregation and condensation protein Rec8/ScpA/Scc1 (kleisin family)